METFLPGQDLESWVDAWYADEPSYELNILGDNGEITEWRWSGNKTEKLFVWTITFPNFPMFRMFWNFWTWPLNPSTMQPTENVFDPSWSANGSNPNHFTAFRQFLHFGTFYRLEHYVAKTDEQNIVGFFNKVHPEYHKVLVTSNNQYYEHKIFVNSTHGYTKNRVCG